MKTKDFAEQVENLPKKQKMVILGIIDLKVENDMQKVLNEMQKIESKMDIQFKVIVWTMGIAFTLIGLLLTIYKFLG